VTIYIWNEISNKAKRHDAPSPSMNMGEIYEKEKFGLEEYEAGFNKTVSKIGAVFMINGKGSLKNKLPIMGVKSPVR